MIKIRLRIPTTEIQPIIKCKNGKPTANLKNVTKIIPKTKNGGIEEALKAH